MSVTLCVLLWARDGKAEALATYEDRVLDLLDDHDARVAFRGRASGEGDTPTEVQILTFASGEAFVGTGVSVGVAGVDGGVGSGVAGGSEVGVGLLAVGAGLGEAPARPGGPALPTRTIVLAARVIRQAGTDRANSTVTARPSVRLLTQLENVPRQTPLQLNSRTGNAMPAARARIVFRPSSLIPTPKSGWWKLTTSQGSSRFTSRRSTWDSGSDMGRGPDQVSPRGLVRQSKGKLRLRSTPLALVRR